MINSIRLQHFRSYNDASYDFSPAVNIIVGPNASGKTNLLEAVLVLARGGSYRAKDHELVGFGDDWARLDAKTTDEVRIVKIIAEPEPGKSYELGGKSYKRLTLQHSLPVVLFEPNHLLLLSGSPEGRRNYLDDLLEQTVQNHAAMRRNYKRVLAQRNALLKRVRKPSNEELFPWNLRLSELGATIARRRTELTEAINGLLAERYRLLSDSSTKTTINYKPEFPVENYESHLLRKLELNLSVDVLRGFTSHGPHREDFHVSFDGHPAEDTASRGEVRTLVLSLKVIELELLRTARENVPLLLLDDVFSELDSVRRHALTDQLQDYQTFITTTDADVVVKNFKSKSTIISTKPFV